MAVSVPKDRRQAASIHWAIVSTTLGPMLLAATPRGICRLSFAEDEADLRQRYPNTELREGGKNIDSFVTDAVRAVERPGDARRIPLDVRGTAFQLAVWQQLRRIPPGQTRTYAQIAAAAGNPAAIRAAGTANGANSVAVLIPCHRVIRSDGGLGGYAYGTDIKRELLRREGAVAASEADLFALAASRD